MKGTGASVRLLQQLYMFRTVSPSALAELTALGRLCALSPGEIAMTQGDEADAALLVLQGELEAVVSKEGTERVVGIIKAGELVGETALFTSGGQRSATVRAKQQTRCLALGPKVMSANIDNPAIIFLEIHMLSTMSRRIRNTNSAIQGIWDAAAPTPLRQPKAASTASTKSLKDRLRGLFGAD